MTGLVTRRALVVLMVLGVSLVIDQPACAQTLDAAKATRVKAAYIYNFAKFATWPADVFKTDDAPIIIGVVGPDPIAATLEKVVRGKTAHNRRIEVRRIAGVYPEAADELRECHLLFVCACESERIGQLWRLLGNRPVLVVSDIEGFAKRGGMIGLALEGGRIVFEIHRAAVEQTGIRLSAKLLKLAKIVG